MPFVMGNGGGLRLGVSVGMNIADEEGTFVNGVIV